jgi:asparagine synthase (glutamine-hydrolysing)
MTMAEGLEMRPPFLDSALVGFGLALPDRFKRRGGASKWIVRQWASEMLPAAVAGRRKWGFRVPLAHWFRGALREMLHDYLTSKRSLSSIYGSPAQVAGLLHRHDRGEADLSSSLWGLLSAEVWFQEGVGKGLAATSSEPYPPREQPALAGV